MLADSRSEVLVTNFAEQWLFLRDVDAKEPDTGFFPGFDENLRRAFRRETELFVGSVLRDDRSVLDLLTADYTGMIRIWDLGSAKSLFSTKIEAPPLYSAAFSGDGKRIVAGAKDTRAYLIDVPAGAQ